MKGLIYWLIIVLAGLLVSACDSESKLAKVDGKTITKEQFDAYLKFKRLPATDEKRRQYLLDQYLEREALSAVIENSAILDKQLIAAEINEFRKEMLVSRYFEKFLSDKVSEQAIQNYYATHAKDYEENKVRVAHILFRTNSAMGETERKVQLTSAQEAYSKIKAGSDFAEIAKKYSQDEISGKKGGDLGWLKQGAIDPRFSQQIFSLEPGAVSEPFETSFGFHVVKLLDGAVVVKRPFEAVKGDIRYQLRNQAKNAELKRVLSEVKIKQY